jgi:threonine dehydratase
VFDFEGAAVRINSWIRSTPLVEGGSTGLLLKCEHEQVTGSFKVRGALNKVLQLTPEERGRGIVAASAGNHGLGVAYAARQAGAQAIVVVPEDAVKTKVDGIRALGCEVILVPGGFGAAEAKGRELASERNAVWISPYNDRQVIEGQGTLGLEVDQQIRDRSSESESWEVYVPVSGGGLVCGVGLALKKRGDVNVIGVQTEAAPYMSAFLSGKDVDEVTETPTLADGLAGPVERGSITFDLLPGAVDEIQLVSESELIETLEFAQSELDLVIEPSAAVALAAARKAGGSRQRVVILSGGNLAPELRSALESGRPLGGDL